jgi:hypothetical protein
MPWGLKRYQQTGQSHFVTFCGYHRRPLFTTDASLQVFENALERVRRNFRLRHHGSPPFENRERWRSLTYDGPSEKGAIPPPGRTFVVPWQSGALAPRQDEKKIKGFSP